MEKGGREHFRTLYVTIGDTTTWQGLFLQYYYIPSLHNWTQGKNSVEMYSLVEDLNLIPNIR